MSKLVVVHCICTLVRSVAVSYSVIIIQVMLQFVITKKKQILSVFRFTYVGADHGGHSKPSSVHFYSFNH